MPDIAFADGKGRLGPLLLFRPQRVGEVSWRSERARDSVPPGASMVTQGVDHAGRGPFCISVQCSIDRNAPIKHLRSRATFQIHLTSDDTFSPALFCTN
jgi:hypothetical protein